MTHSIRKGNKLIGALLALVMVLSTLAGVLPFTALEVRAAGTEKTITGLGVGAITDPVTPTKGNDSWSGSYVYYGKFDGSPTKYRVLDKDSSDFGVTKSLLLDCDSVLYSAQFDTDGVPNEGTQHPNDWQYSDVKAGLNGDRFLNLLHNFTKAEKDAIAKSTKATSEDGNLYDYHVFAPLKGEKIFLLDAREATRSTYGYYPNEDSLTTSRKKGGNWWLRSTQRSYNDDYSQAEFVAAGAIINRIVRSSQGISPAFNVDSKNILFSSLVRGKAREPGAEYKLTLLDDSLGVTFDSNNVTRNGNTVTVSGLSYSNNVNPTQCSVVITDGEWTTSGWSNDATLKHYSKLTVENAGNIDKTGTFELPGDYSSNWNVYLVAEKVNDDDVTDYASTPVKVEIPQLQPMTIKMDNNVLKKDGNNWTLTGEVLKLTEGDYQLGTDIDTPRTISVEGNVTLDLNGHGIKHNTNHEGNVIRVESNGSLTINDSTGSTVTHRYSINEQTHTGDVNDESGATTFTGGYITGGYATGDDGSGAGIDNDGTLIVNSGTIIGNNGGSSNHKGGGVLNNGTFILNNGRIIGNYANGEGAGVYCGGGTFTMNGGNIQHNYAQSQGGGVYIDHNATFVMNDDNGYNSSIRDNTSEGPAGGVSCRDGAIFTMTGGYIEDNISKGPSITGVGVNISSGATFNLSGDVEIRNNKNQTPQDSNVYLDGASYITIKGELGNVTPIGVNSGSTGVITNTENTNYNDASKFKGEGHFYVYKNANSQLELTAGCKVRYNANGGVGVVPVDDNKYNPNDTVQVKKPEQLKKTNHYFATWNTKADGKGTNYKAGDTFNIDTSTILYAQWKELTDDQKPHAIEDIVWNGSPKALITAPTSSLSGYTIEYSTNGTNWSSEIPTGDSVGLYTIKVRYKNDTDNSDIIEMDDIEVGISPDPNEETIRTVMSEVTPLGGEYTGNPIDLVKAPTTQLPVGYSMVYAVTEDYREPDASHYSETIPTGTYPISYHVWYKVKKDDSDATFVQEVVADITMKDVPIPTPTPTPTPTPAPDEDYDVPVENKGEIDIKAHISDGVATLADVLYEDIDLALQDRGEELPDDLEDKLVLDISGANQTVTGVNIGTQSLHNITGAVSNYPEIDVIEIRLTDATVALDVAAAESVVSQAQGDTIRLMVNEKKESSLNSAQRSAISPFSFRSIFEAYFESDGTRIGDFDGGKVTLSIKDDTPADMDNRYFHFYYVPEDGNLTRYISWYENGMFSFKTDHFSDYALVYDETARNDTLPEGFTRKNNGTLKYTDDELGTAIIADEVVREGFTYRMYNPNTGEHTYTKNYDEMVYMVACGWNHEEEADFVTNEYFMDDSILVYRLYSEYTGLHHFTTDREEAIWDVKALGYNFEGIVFYAQSLDNADAMAMYRLYNPYDYQHLWTTNKGEYDYLGAIGWNQEGVAFKVQ